MGLGAGVLGPAILAELGYGGGAIAAGVGAGLGAAGAAAVPLAFEVDVPGNFQAEITVW